MLGSLDPAKILVILVIALVVLGPERLPRFAREAGAMWHQIVKMREQVVSEIRDALPDDLPTRADLPRIPRPTPGAVSGFVTGLMAPSSTAPRSDSDESTELVPDDDFDLETMPSRQRTAGGSYRNESEVKGHLVIHPELGDFSFPADDPNMN